MAETTKCKLRAMRSKAANHRITKYETAKSKLARLREVQARQLRLKATEREDGSGDRETIAQDTEPAKTLEGISPAPLGDVHVESPEPLPPLVLEDIESVEESFEPAVRHIQPKDMKPYLRDNNKYEIDPRTGCNCGWYIFYSAVCTHTYWKHRGTCGQTVTRSGVNGFCKSPAKINHIDEVKVTKMCIACTEKMSKPIR
ncbi:hypothetical protein MferCBS31731_004354 [Microsporum ferrugineum]